MDQAQTQAQRPVGFHAGLPVGACGADRSHGDSMVFGVLHHRGWRIEPHGLVVEQRGEEFWSSVYLQVGAGVGQQREADGVRFGKSVKSKRAHGLGDGVDDVWGNALARHGLAQLGRG